MLGSVSLRKQCARASSRVTLETTAPKFLAVDGRSKPPLGRAPKPPRARIHCSRKVSKTAERRCSFTHYARTKSLPRRTSKPQSARNRWSSQRLCVRQHAKTLHQRRISAHSTRDPCSSVLGSHRALETTARVYSYFESSTGKIR